MHCLNQVHYLINMYLILQVHFLFYTNDFHLLENMFSHHLHY